MEYEKWSDYTIMLFLAPLLIMASLALGIYFTMPLLILHGIYNKFEVPYYICLFASTLTFSYFAINSAYRQIKDKHYFNRQ